MLEEEIIDKYADIIQQSTLEFIDVFKKLKMTPKLAKVSLKITLQAIEIAEKEAQDAFRK